MSRTRTPQRIVSLLVIPVLVFLTRAVCSSAAEAPSRRYEIAYATYLGGGRAEQLREVIPLADGTLLVGGQTNSNDLPTTPGVVQPKYGGEEPPDGHPGVVGGDCFLARLDAGGRGILAATYFGGSKQERNVYGMALDRQSNVVITSATRSPDLPTTPGCFQPKYGGPPSDWAAGKLSIDLEQLIWCTYVGGSRDDFPRGGLALDAEDNVVIVGGTTSPDFPLSAGSYRDRLQGERDAAIVKLRADGSGLIFGTLLGGGDWDGLMGVCIDRAGQGDLYVAGHSQSRDLPTAETAAQPRAGGKSDAFLARFSGDGKRLLSVTYLGGKENEFAEHRLWLDADGSLLLTGVTGSEDFPTTEAAFQPRLGGKTDGFLTRLAADGTRFTFSTFLGGSDGEFFLMPTRDAAGNIYVVGTTRSEDFPVTEEAIQREFRGAAGPWDGDGVLAVFSPDGSRLLYATYLGGSGADLIRSLALGPRGEIYLVGSTSSADFPVTAGAVQAKMAGPSDAFIVKLAPVR